MGFVRSPNNFGPNDLALLVENTDDFRGAFSKFEYEYEFLGGYDALGGFVVYTAADPEIYGVQLEFLMGDEILDLKINSFVIEFITYNGNQQLFNVASMVFYFAAGGEVIFIPHISPIKMELYLTDIDIFRGVLEALLFLCFIVQLVNSIVGIKRLLNKYDKYEYDLTSALTPI